MASVVNMYPYVDDSERRETFNLEVADSNLSHSKSFCNLRLISNFFISVYRAAFLSFFRLFCEAQLRLCVEICPLCQEIVITSFRNTPKTKDKP